MTYNEVKLCRRASGGLFFQGVVYEATTGVILTVKVVTGHC